MDILNPGVFVRLAFFMRVEKWENMATQMGKWMDYVVNLFTSHFLSAFFCKKMEFDFFWSQKTTKCRNVPSIVPSRAHIIDASHRYDGQIESESNTWRWRGAAFSGMSSRCLPFKRVGTVRSD